MRLLSVALLGIVINLSLIASAQGGHKIHRAVPKPTRGLSTRNVGLASWYGKHEQGRKMANGQRFDRHKFTAASRTVPLGTNIRVTNTKTGLSTTVTITDRGPWVKTRILDLAEAPAKEIGCDGLCSIVYTYTPNIDVQPLEIATEIEP
jgi:rare lipoprotein A (peptidoglycan hydrolase)